VVSKGAQEIKEGGWILGGGWNHELWGGELPDLHWIDDVAPKHLVSFIHSLDHLSILCCDSCGSDFFTSSVRAAK
jgi:predicted amidohydrolase YtcJ